MRKTMVWTMLLTMLIATVVLVNPATTLGTKVYVDPPKKGPLTVGTTFTLDIAVDYVEDLWGYQFELTFNPEVLHGINVEDGGFFEPFEFAVLPGPGFDNEAGVLGLFGAALSVKMGVDGSGVLAIVTFEVVGGGVSPIILGDNTGLMNRYGQWIIHGREYVEDGVVYTSEPYVNYSWSPTEVDVGTTVTFDGSACFDPDEYPDKGDIKSWVWDFGDSGGSGMIAEHTYSDYGIYEVTLTATDNDDETWFKTKTLTIRRDLAVTGIDCLAHTYHGRIYALTGTTEMPITAIIENLGTVTETYITTLTINGLCLGPITGTIEPGDFAYATFLWDTGDALTNCGLYTITAEVTNDVDMDPTNNVMSTTSYVHARAEPKAASAPLSPRCFKIKSHGDTFYFKGKVNNVESPATAIDGVWARLAFLVITPAGLPRIYRTNAVYVENGETLPKDELLIATWVGITRGNVGIYAVEAFVEFGWDGVTFPFRGLESQTYTFSIVA